MTQELLYDYWKHTNFMLHYFLIYFFMKMAAGIYAEEWSSIPFFSDVPPHILQRELFSTFSEERFAQIQYMSDIHKLSYKLEKADCAPQDSFYRRILKEC